MSASVSRGCFMYRNVVGCACACTYVDECGCVHVYGEGSVTECLFDWLCVGVNECVCYMCVFIVCACVAEYVCADMDVRVDVCSSVDVCAHLSMCALVYLRLWPLECLVSLRTK